jgi:hypothetical protein
LLPQAFNDSFAHLQDIRGLGVVLVFLVLVHLPNNPLPPITSPSYTPVGF